MGKLSLNDAITEVINQYVSTINAGDYEGLISLWNDDAVHMPPNTPALIGKEQLRPFFKSLFADFQIEFTHNLEEVRTFTNDWGFACGTVTYIFTPKKEGEIMKGSFKFLTILENQDDDSWKIARNSFNLNQ